MATAPGRFISADSHIVEPAALWEQLPAPQRAMLPKAEARTATDSHQRLRDQERDGVQAEVLFPTAAIVLFGLGDAQTQQAAFALYNDYLADFCRTAPQRYLGIACIATYDIDEAVNELYRARDLGLVGVTIWQTPDPRLPLKSTHYEPLWAAAAETGTPVHLHAGTGHVTVRDPAPLSATEELRGTVNHTQHETNNALFDMIFSGAFDRHPDLRLALADSECGWLPFVLQQWDYIAERVAKKERMPIARKPSEIFDQHVFATWRQDYSGTRHFTWWGRNSLMWSNNYPQPTSTFPRSRETIAHHIGALPTDVQAKLVRDNALRLYGLEL